MDKTAKVSISAALIGVLCFFLPWVQVSCGSSHDSLSGVDLARNGHGSLWAIPLLFLLVILARFIPAWQGKLDFGALFSFIAGLINAYLMNRERMRAEDSSTLLSVRLTGWFWLGLAVSIVVAITGAIAFLKRPKPS